MSIYSILYKLHTEGRFEEVRGLLTKEITDFRYILAPRERFMCFDARKLKLDYIKQEFLWYLVGDKFDTSIAKLATMWKDLINKDGSINSNYGHHIFSQATAGRAVSNFARCAHTLAEDPSSRRAVITILSNDYLNSETKDYPCTAYLNFLVRDNYLLLLVRMRSQDAIYGMGNDAPFFSFVQELMYVTLKNSPGFEKLQLGPYSHMADSFHVYERHFKMLEDIVEEPGMKNDWHATCPAMTIATPYELTTLVHNLRQGLSIESFKDSNDAFVRWVLERDDPATILRPEVAYGN